MAQRLKGRPAARIWPRAEQYGGKSSKVEEKVKKAEVRRKFGQGGKKLTTQDKSFPTYPSNNTQIIAPIPLSSVDGLPIV